MDKKQLIDLFEKETGEFPYYSGLPSNYADLAIARINPRYFDFLEDKLIELMSNG